MKLPETVKRFVEVTTSSVVESASELHGGLTSRVWLCGLADGSAVVAKRLAELLDANALLAGEVAALSALSSGAFARNDVPQLLGYDETERLIVMTGMPGERVVTANEVRQRVRAMAEWLVALHAISPPPALQSWRRWGPEVARRPSITERPEIWDRFTQAWDRIDHPPWEALRHQRLLHRDLHPLNVLWQDETIAAVVDWANACIGHPHADLAHLRWNLAVLVDQSAADQLVHSYRDLGGLPDSYDPRWDLQEVNSLGGVGADLEVGNQAWLDAGRHDLDHAAVLRATENFVETALLQLDDE